MGTVNAVCLVAHPDDCLIFAKPYIDTHSEFQWRIVYLTYTAQDPRAQEVSGYWTRRNINTEFLGFLDRYQDQETQQLNFWYGLDAEAALRSAVEDADLILTHNANGDYGHIHHKLVHNAVKDLDKTKVYFADKLNYNVIYNATTDLSLDDFLLHKDVLSGFEQLNCGFYLE